MPGCRTKAKLLLGLLRCAWAGNTLQEWSLLCETPCRTHIAALTVLVSQLDATDE